jgi:hypothetical protein
MEESKISTLANGGGIIQNGSIPDTLKDIEKVLR